MLGVTLRMTMTSSGFEGMSLDDMAVDGVAVWRDWVKVRVCEQVKMGWMTLGLLIKVEEGR